MSSRKQTIIPAKAAIETQPPVLFASRLALREGNGKKPIYQMHKWWARRLGSVFRSLLLAATTPSSKAKMLTKDFFYKRHDLSGLRVMDPFVGGGTSLIEAAKCGASVIGVDIDPVACFVTAKELEAFNEQDLLKEFQAVETKVKEEIQQWYKTVLPDGRVGSIMYAFWVDKIECPSCQKIFEGHPHFQLRRFQQTGKQTVFCSHCGTINTMPLAWSHFTCASCHKKTNVTSGPVQKGAFICPNCETKTPMQAIINDRKPLPQKLFALEVLIDGTEERLFKKADKTDLDLFKKAHRRWLQRRKSDRFIPRDFIPVRNRDDRRPVSFGYRRYQDLFNSRQLLCLSILAEAINGIQNMDARELLSLAFSDCLASNNMFCFYAFDYGKLTPLFGLHAYVKMSRPVENNVWGTDLGRGTFSKCFKKMLRGKRYAVKPYEYKYTKTSTKKYFTGESIKCQLHVRKLPADLNGNSFALLLNQSSKKLSAIPSNSVDLILSDPPYYNNLAYSELSDFYHVWLKRLRLERYLGNDHTRTPLKESFYVSQRSGKAEESHKRFAKGLSQTFAECSRILKESGLFVFTFHHNDPKAWAALSNAVLSSDFDVTNVFPVRSEGQSRFHSDDGNIKWDEVFVCRKRHKKHYREDVDNKDEILERIERRANRQLSYWIYILKKKKLDFNPCDARSLKSGLILMHLSKASISFPDLGTLFSDNYSTNKLKTTTIAEGVTK